MKDFDKIFFFGQPIIKVVLKLLVENFFKSIITYYLKICGKASFKYTSTI